MQLGWIDFSNSDRKKAFDVMHLLMEKGAVDEIGIGTIRDRFANYFFPGTSTIMTRAKYFLLVPYAIRDVCRTTTSRSVRRIREEISEKERQTALELMEGTDTNGVIGRTELPNHWVQRTPDIIYWNGIRTYGLLKYSDMSMDECIRLSLLRRDEMKRKELGKHNNTEEDNSQDDRDAGLDSIIDLWNLPDVKSDWLVNVNIKLTFEEASHLETCIIDNTGESLLAYILRNKISIDDCDSFESLAAKLSPQVDEEMRTMFQLAVDFSNLVYLARIRYNMILSGGESLAAKSEWEECSYNLHYLSSVDLDAVFARLNITDAFQKKFLRDIRAAFHNNDIPSADTAIKARERDLKHDRAKLQHCSKYYDGHWLGGRHLDYRFANTKQIVDDIYQGIGD